ncbi:uncharacterized protein LOC105775266 [Gossypium raimondii]|uniref:uncharacterized protein LOC105775266 n=1 Tax=Gossypium raimondii TaxID=29730 RepID=UPI00063AA15F|nr:uncharacterized protein LOC105775266 [Gossypium raimondii]
MGAGYQVAAAIYELNAGLWAILDGLELAWEKKLTKLLVERDSVSVVKMVREQSREDDTNLVSRIKDLLMRQWEVTVQYTPKLVNMAVDCMANVRADEALNLVIYFQYTACSSEDNYTPIFNGCFD